MSYGGFMVGSIGVEGVNYVVGVYCTAHAFSSSFASSLMVGGFCCSTVNLGSWGRHFYTPRNEVGGYTGISLSVCPSVCLSVDTNLYLLLLLGLCMDFDETLHTLYMI
jgi:hypothetical protein